MEQMTELTKKVQNKSNVCSVLFLYSIIFAGNIKDKGYFKAKLIHFDDIEADDFNIVNSLGDELNQGVYTK